MSNFIPCTVLGYKSERNPYGTLPKRLSDFCPVTVYPPSFPLTTPPDPGNVISYAGGTAEIAITVRGSDFYWAICAAMATATIAFLGLAYTKPREHRIFHYITAGITMVASIAYFSMASNIGWTPTTVEFIRSNPKVAGLNREIFYVRYIDWFITTPLLLLDLLLTAGLPTPTILWVMLIDEIMIVCGLVGALVRSSYKWGYFTFGMARALRLDIYLQSANEITVGSFLHRLRPPLGSPQKRQPPRLRRRQDLPPLRYMDFCTMVSLFNKTCSC